MPAPATAAELLELIQRSGVVDEAKLRGYVQRLQTTGTMPTDPQKLAGLLVRDAILTYFQAEQLLQGKYKRFTIGKYKVLEKLGAGGMAQVFLCEHKLMRRRVAIKVLPTAKAEDQASLDRFYREARAVAAVDHPNIVRAYDIDQDENLHFLVMEYVDGTNLQDLVKKFGPLDVLRACHYIYGAAVGLQHAHEIGLVHRDIKPGNILIDRAGVVKILDMGLARFFNDDDDVLTKKYDENVLGTADYLAPEQALDSHTVDIRADIYSLGATFYFLLTARAPFPEGSVAQKLIWHQNRTPRPIKSIRSEVPVEVIAVVDRMMAKDPSKRFQTPAEVMAALAHWVSTPISPPSERELPSVSPAAGGGGGRGPVSMTGVAPVASPSTARPGPTNDGSPTEKPAPTVTTTASPAVASRVATPAPEPLPLGDAVPDTAEPAVWANLATETQSEARSDTDPPPPQRERAPRPRRTTTTQPSQGKPTLLYAGLGLVALIALASGVYFGFLRKPSTPEPPGTTGRRIVVSKAGGENTVPTLREALTRANPGDTIAIAEPKLVEATLRLDPKRHKDLTIEGATGEGKPAPVIEFAPGAVGAMLEATSVEGFKLKNLEFDGLSEGKDARFRADVGVQVSGVSPGATIENVSIRNAKVAGFRILNATGDTRPITLDRVRVYGCAPTADGVLISGTAAETRHVVLRHCRLEGPGRAGVRLDLAAGSTEVEITGNRIYNLDSGLVIARVAEGKTARAALTGNTVYQTRVGLLFDFAPHENKGKFELSATQNYFAKTPELAKSLGSGGAVAGVTASDNAHDPETSQSNFSVAATSLPAPLIPPPTGADDPMFLRFPGGNNPEVGGKKVGAQ